MGLRAARVLPLALLLASATLATPAAAQSATPTSTATATATPTDPFRDREDRMAVLVDRARAANGLLPLARSPELDRAALEHAQDMAAQGYMEHEAPDGSTPGSRARREGYNAPPGSGWMAIETISAISDAPEGALGWWLGDGIHRRVVLRATWRELGIAYVAGGPYGRFWVALFGCRPNVLPPVLLDGVLSIPDETCDHADGVFGSAQSIRVGDRGDTARAAGWEAYAPQRPWPAGRPATVLYQDAGGHQLEARAADPTGAAAEPAGN